MHKKFRRARWGIRKQLAKNVMIVTSVSSILFILILNVYDECSHYLGILHWTSEPNACKVETVEVRFNATFISSNLHQQTPLGRENKNVIDLTTPNTLLHVRGTLPSPQKQKKSMMITNQIESFTEFPLDGTFELRKAGAERACYEMLDTAMAREGRASTGDHTTNMRFSVGYTVSPVKDVKDSRSAFYNKNMLQLIKLRGESFVKQPRYFQSAGSAKKNKWVYFHRIVPSPSGPANNKVVEIKWCPIFKAASTPWLAVFTKLSKALTNNTEAQIKHGRMGFMELARTYRLLTPRIYDKSVHPFKYSMIVVRHPFKRLLSAYRDKIERVKGRLYYYNKYSTRILAKFRKSQLGALERNSKDKDFSLKVPTFQEFVQYVLSTELRKLDEHWRPIFLDCNPCHRTFDFILKVETLNGDKDKVMQYLHVSPSDPLYKEVDDVWLRWNNPSGTNQPGRNESYYYGQLTNDDIEKLYNLYEPDFRIFDYSPDAYFLMGKDA